MRARRGLALAAVLAALVLMAMVVAVSSQRALVAARLSMLERARADMAAALAGAQAEALASGPDSSQLAAFAPGAIIAAGNVVAGQAQASWAVVGAAPRYARVEMEAVAPVFRGSARERRRGLVTAMIDTSGGSYWVLAGGAGWFKVPLP